MQLHHPTGYVRHIAPFVILFGALCVFLYFQFKKIELLETEVRTIKSALNETNSVLLSNTNQLSQKFTDLQLKTVSISDTLSDAQQNIDAVRNQVGGVTQSVGAISGTVTNLQKLAEVDPEILKKYSKVYFMNENYVPLHLSTIPSEFTYSNNRQEQFLSEATPYLTNLLLNAKANGVTLYVKSGYRSFAEQKSLKTNYSVVYGAGTANTFSADQGYSEHQLGTTLDFITSGLGGNLSGFDKTPAFTWLQDNAYKYGFILSYPKGNTYYVYEPWHWRFVGVLLATYLHNSNKNFYDLDQREIDKYLVNAFD